MKVEVAVAYHKPSVIISNECLLPLQVGKDCSDYDLDICADNKGDNISSKHGYAELCGLYWLWKNSNADIKGLFHYRRFLDLNITSEHAGEKYYEISISDNFSPENFLDKMDINTERIVSILNKNTVITRNREDLRTWSNYTVAKHYKAVHIGEHLDIALEALKEFYPEYYNTAVGLFNGHDSYFANMTIMKKADFNRYCTWLFDILDKVEPTINLYDKRLAPGTNYSRWAGFLGERLTSVFIQKQKEDGLRVAEFPAVILVPESEKKWYEINTFDADSYNKSRTYKTISIPNNECKENPKVSVIITAYNVEKYIAKAIESVINQTLRNIEIIIVNDGSTDSTLEIIRYFCEMDLRIIIVDQENKGTGEARNSGFKMAKGEYIHFMDGDDYMDIDFLESLVLNAEKYKSDLVISTHRSVEDGTNRIISSSSLPHTLIKGNLNVTNNIDLLLVPGHLWDKIIKRKFIIDEKFPCNGGEDISFWWTIILKAKNVSVYRTPKYNYLIRSTSVQSNSVYLLGVFINAKDIQKFVFAQDDIQIKEMFEIFKCILVGHMIYRAKFMLIRDKKFRYEFFKSSREFLNTEKMVLSKEIEKKRAYFYTDFEQIEKLRNEDNFKKWTKLCNLNKPSTESLGVNKLAVRRITMTIRTFFGKVRRKLLRIILGRDLFILLTNFDNRINQINNINQINANEIENNLKQINANINQIGNNISQQINAFSYESAYHSQGLIKHIYESKTVRDINTKTFAKYKSIYKSRDIVVMGAGPSLNYYMPKENCITIGTNMTVLYDKVKLDYLFVQDVDLFKNNKNAEEEILNYECKKFFSFWGTYIYNFPEKYKNIKNMEEFCSYIVGHVDNNVKNYLIYNKYTGYTIPFNICNAPLSDFFSVIFPAVQFALWTYPKRIYIVGCDCSQSPNNIVHFYENEKKDDEIIPNIPVIQGWHKIKEFQQIYYPDVEMISINPVFLKGLFKDEFTPSYLEDNPNATKTN
jgi:glycosyltransferase involved in cell wall biosynthesis